jgi:hypothetical protein
MIDVFDVEAIVGRQPKPHTCFRCGRPWDVGVTRGLVHRFKQITGKRWRRGCGLVFPLAADYIMVTGLPPLEVPEEVSLCIRCAVWYVETLTRKVYGGN